MKSVKLVLRGLPFPIHGVWVHPCDADGRPAIISLHKSPKFLLSGRTDADAIVNTIQAMRFWRDHTKKAGKET